MENEPVSNSYKLDAAPVEAGLAERLRQSADDMEDVYSRRAGIPIKAVTSNLMREAASAIETQSAEIARQAEDIRVLTFTNENLRTAFDSQRDFIAGQGVRLAAIEGQSYWQARAEKLSEALRDMLAGWQYIRANHGDLYGVGWDRAEGKARAALANAQPTQGEGK